MVTSAAPAGAATTQTRSDWAVRSTGGATAPVAQATAAGPVSTTPATSSRAASQRLQPVPGGVRAGHAPGRMFGYTEQSFVM